MSTGMGLFISGAGIARENQTSQSYWTAPNTEYLNEPFAQTAMTETADGSIEVTFQRTETVKIKGDPSQIADLFPAGFNFGQAYSNAYDGGPSSSYAKAPSPQSTRDYPTSNGQPIPQRAMLGSSSGSDFGGSSAMSEALVPQSSSFYGLAGGIVDVKIA